MENKMFSINEISQDDKNKIILKLKSIYNARIKIMNLVDEKNTFIWRNKNLNIFIIQSPLTRYPDGSKFTVFFTDDNKENDSLDSIDLRGKIKDLYTYDRISYSEEDLIRFFMDNNLIDHNKKVVEDSIFMIPFFNKSFNDFINDKNLKTSIENFADKEYDKIVNQLSQKVGKTINYNRRILFAGKNDSELIIKTVNNEYFEYTFTECLWAYNNQKWFLCSAGLGSVIESLMLITIRNYNNSELNKIIKNQPTSADLRRAFRSSPINASEKQDTRLKNIFNIRNKMDHFSTGFALKEDADMLLDGIRMIFNDFYRQSINKE